MILVGDRAVWFTPAGDLAIDLGDAGRVRIAGTEYALDAYAARAWSPRYHVASEAGDRVVVHDARTLVRVATLEVEVVMQLAVDDTRVLWADRRGRVGLADIPQ